MRRNELANDLLKASTTQQLPPMLQVSVPLIIFFSFQILMTLEHNFLLNSFHAESKYLQKLSTPECLQYLSQGMPFQSQSLVWTFRGI